MAKATKKAKSRTDELLDELLKDCKSPEDILGKHGLLQQLSKRAIERALAGELTTHLGYEAHDRADEPRQNTRNGSSAKTLISEHGPVPIEIPRDRLGSFEPQLIPKGERRLKRIDEQIIALYTRGMTTRDIQAHLLEIYGVEISPSLISNVTSEVSADAQAWQNRPLEAIYPIVYFDALFVKTRQSGVSAPRAVYLALAINMEGHKELLGLWIAESEGASFWLSVLTELQNRGMHDCLIACVDGLNGFDKALETVFPRTCVQMCIVHQVRNSLRQTSWKHRKDLARDLRSIYNAATIAAAEQALEQFAQRWDELYPRISQSWRRHWPKLTTLFDYPPEIRKVIYTTNAIESLNYSLRRVLNNRGAFPDDDSVRKLLYLAINKVSKKWTMPLHDWLAALNRFMIMFPNRLPQ